MKTGLIASVIVSQVTHQISKVCGLNFVGGLAWLK